MERIKVVGLGPGSRDYLVPKAEKVIKGGDIIIGGKRNIEGIQDLIEEKEVRYIDRHLDELVEFINEKLKMDKTIVIVVSGDPGFFSMTKFISRNFGDETFQLIPGISSLQYFFNRIGLTYQESFLGSLHGRKTKYLEKLKKGVDVGLLTDKKNTPQKIALDCIEYGIDPKTEIFIGENLSYRDEIVTTISLESLREDRREYEMNVVIIKGQK